MELQIKKYQQPADIEFNFEELKAELTERVEGYKTIVYTDATIKEAKADRAALNRLDKALNDERIRLEKEYMAPFAKFKGQVAELCGIVKEASNAIDVQVKEFEELQKQKKTEDILKVFNETIYQAYPWLDSELIWNSKWLNVSYSMKQIQKDLEEVGQRIAADLGILSRLPQYSFEAQETYKRTLKLEDAMWTADNLKQMDEAKKVMIGDQAVEPKVTDIYARPLTPEEIQIHVLQFRCYCTMEQAMKLRQFMIENGIRFERA